MTDECSKTSISELIGIIASGAISTNDVYEGTIRSINPMQITLVNDAKIILSSVNIVIPEYLRRKTAKVTFSFTFDGETQTKSQTIVIHEGLAAGDKVYLMKYNNGKKYFVLGKK